MGQPKPHLKHNLNVITEKKIPRVYALKKTNKLIYSGYLSLGGLWVIFIFSFILVYFQFFCSDQVQPYF